MDLSSLNPEDFIPKDYSKPQYGPCCKRDEQSLQAALVDERIEKALVEHAREEESHDAGIWDALEIIDAAAKLLDKDLIGPNAGPDIDMPLAIYLKCLQFQSRCEKFIDDWLKENIEEVEKASKKEEKK